MPKLTLTKEEAQDIVYRDHPRAKIVRNEIVDNTRWSVCYDLIFELDGKLYQGCYSRGATEQQDEHPFEYDDNPEFVQVEAYERTITDYRPVDD
jgi:hypothetical protein